MSERYTHQITRAVLAAFLWSMAAGMPASAEPQPEIAVADVELRDRLFTRLKQARTLAEGQAIENAIWEMWMANAPTTAVARDVEAAMTARSSYDFDKAMALLDGVVATAPDYAEGWNQRAFVRFLRDEFDRALEDLDRALELEPKHFGALAGKAVILMRQGRMELGQEALREAVAIHPWLRERSMLIPAPGETGPEPRGRDI